MRILAFLVNFTFFPCHTFEYFTMFSPYGTQTLTFFLFFYQQLTPKGVFIMEISRRDYMLVEQQQT